MTAAKRYTTNAGSARLVFKAGGDLVALTYPVPKTGYKAQGAYGSRPIFAGESTNDHYQRQVLAAGEDGAKKLEPYKPNAPRNRPKEMLINVVGNRHKLHPCIKHETYRGSSRIKLGDDKGLTNPWKTMNQVFAECSQAQEVTGMGNQGISSTLARELHKRQEIYGRK